MKWILAIIIIVMLLGPLRRWAGRHWAILVSVLAGAAFGFLAGLFVMGKIGWSYPYLPLLWALVGAIAVGRAGPAWLRHIGKDGKNGQSSRRH